MSKREEYLIIEPLIAYREFQIQHVKDKNEFRISGIGYGVGAGNLKEGVNKATCVTRPDLGLITYSYLMGTVNSDEPKKKKRKHKVPHWSCECGFYAYKDKFDLAVSLSHSLSNYGSTLLSSFATWWSSNSDTQYIGAEVEFTGKVIEHETGYRAERLEIKKLLWLYKKDVVEIEVKKEEKIDVGEEIEVITDSLAQTTTSAPTATETMILQNNYIQRIPQRSGQLRQQRGYQITNIPGTSSDSDSDSSPATKTIPNKQVIKSLQDYYDVPVIYYRDYFRKEF